MGAENERECSSGLYSKRGLTLHNREGAAVATVHPARLHRAEPSERG